MQLLNHNQRPWKTFSFGFTIVILTSFLFENILAEYDCSAKDDGWYYDPEFCHIYWRCIHGASEEFECASGTAWDHHENRCNWLDSVDCSRAEKTTAKPIADYDDEQELAEENNHNHNNEDDDEPPIVVVKKTKKKKKKQKKIETKLRKLDADENEDTTTTRKKSDTESVLSDTNAGSTNGKDNSGNSLAIECQPTGIYSISDPTECNSYYQCDKGTRTKLSCPERKLFDTEKRECNDHERVTCGARAINLSDKNQCVNKRDGIHPDPERDCHFYYQCLAQNKMREARCPGDQKFSSYTGRCGPASAAPIPCGSFIPGSAAAKNHWNSGTFIPIFLTMVLAVKLNFQ